MRSSSSASSRSDSPERSKTRPNSTLPLAPSPALRAALPGVDDPAGLPVYVDARISALEKCIVGGGSRSIKILVDPEVFTRMPGIEVVETPGEE